MSKFLTEEQKRIYDTITKSMRGLKTYDSRTDGHSYAMRTEGYTYAWENPEFTKDPARAAKNGIPHYQGEEVKSYVHFGGRDTTQYENMDNMDILPKILKNGSDQCPNIKDEIECVCREKFNFSPSKLPNGMIVDSRAEGQDGIREVADYLETRLRDGTLKPAEEILKMSQDEFNDYTKKQERIYYEFRDGINRIMPLSEGIVISSEGSLKEICNTFGLEYGNELDTYDTEFYKSGTQERLGMPNMLEGFVGYLREAAEHIPEKSFMDTYMEPVEKERERNREKERKDYGRSCGRIAKETGIPFEAALAIGPDKRLCQAFSSVLESMAADITGVERRITNDPKIHSGNQAKKEIDRAYDEILHELCETDIDRRNNQIDRLIYDTEKTSLCDNIAMGDLREKILGMGQKGSMRIASAMGDALEQGKKRIEEKAHDLFEKSRSQKSLCDMPLSERLEAGRQNGRINVADALNQAKRSLQARKNQKEKKTNRENDDLER